MPLMPLGLGKEKESRVSKGRMEGNGAIVDTVWL